MRYENKQTQVTAATSRLVKHLRYSRLDCLGPIEPFLCLLVVNPKVFRFQLALDLENTIRGSNVVVTVVV